MTDYFIQRLKDNSPNLHILNRTKNDTEPCEVYCSDCGNTFTTNKHNIYGNLKGKTKGCPICSGQRCVKGINDFNTKNPDLVQYLEDKTVGETHTPNSSKKVVCICPNCKGKRTIQLFRLTKEGYKCLTCDDGITYPNKFIRFLMKELGVEYIAEYSLCGKKFDCYFEYNGKKYIVEMDGGQHYFRTGRGRSLEEEKANDLLKDNIAKENDITMIRINCSKTSLIKKNIIESQLNNIFDLSSVNWDYIKLKSNNSLMVDICKTFREKELTASELCDMYNLCKNTVLKYLHRGTEIGLCNYSAEEAYAKGVAKGRETVAKNRGIKVSAYKDGEFIGSYQSVGECARELKEKFSDMNFYDSTIRKAIKDKKSCMYKGFYIERK